MGKSMSGTPQYDYIYSCKHSFAILILEVTCTTFGRGDQNYFNLFIYLIIPQTVKLINYTDM